MTLGGWTRLGIVFSVLYGALVFGVGYSERPRVEWLQSAWLYEAAEVIAAAISKEDGKPITASDVRQQMRKETDAENLAWLQQVAVSPTERQTRFSAAVKRLNEKHMAAIAELPKRTREHWLGVFAWWAGGVMAVFAIGCTIRWVFRGFRKSAA